MPLPDTDGALEAELERIERERRATTSPSGRKLLAIERRRVLIELAR
jgi:hypothetical protein